MNIGMLDKIFIILYGHAKWFKSMFKDFWPSDLSFVVIIDVSVIFGVNVLTIMKALNLPIKGNQTVGLLVYSFCLLVTWLYYRKRSEIVLENHKKNGGIMPTIAKGLFLLYVILSFALFVFFD